MHYRHGGDVGGFNEHCFSTQKRLSRSAVGDDAVAEPALVRKVGESEKTEFGVVESLGKRKVPPRRGEEL